MCPFDVKLHAVFINFQSFLRYVMGWECCCVQYRSRLMVILSFVVLNYTRCGILGNHRTTNMWTSGGGGGLEISACELKCWLLAVQRVGLQISLRLRKCAKGRASCLWIGCQYCLCRHFILYIWICCCYMEISLLILLFRCWCYVQLAREWSMDGMCESSSTELLVCVTMVQKYNWLENRCAVLLAVILCLMEVQGSFRYWGDKHVLMPQTLSALEVYIANELQIVHIRPLHSHHRHLSIFHTVAPRLVSQRRRNCQVSVARRWQLPWCRRLL
jgi:hypothetical protein